MRRQRHRIRTSIQSRKERLAEQHASKERHEQEQPASLTARVAGAVEQAAGSLPGLAKAGAARLKDEVADVARAAEAKVADLTGREESAGHA